MTTHTDSVLLSLFQEEGSRHGIIGQTPDANPYSYSIGSLSSSLPIKVSGMYAIALPFIAPAHIVGLPASKAGALNINFAAVHLHEVFLEGDYNNYFKIYSENSKETELRYILDPQVMAYTIDFLKTFHWEIHKHTLYIFDDGALPDLTIADTFIRHIKPKTTAGSIYALSVIRAKEVLLPSSSKLRCPVCSEKLQKGKSWLACPVGHGYLLTGSQLINTRIDSSSFAKQLAEAYGRAPKTYTQIAHDEHEEIKCPNCHSMMLLLKYQFSDIFIDVCRSCPYRWIDGMELNTILGAYRHE